MNQQRALQIAELIDAFRVIPRILILGFAYFSIAVVWYLLEWYIGLPAAERGAEASGFAFGVITVVVGLFTNAVKLYQQTGRQWGHNE